MGEIEAFDRRYLRPCILTEPFCFSQKLGHLYEDALYILLQHAPEVSKVLRGQQVFRSLEAGGRRTLGEFDFLIQVGDSWQHIELAVKFYLARNKDGQMYWPGPDARDNWERKRTRMRTHQFSLSECAEGKELIDEITEERGVESKLLLYGCLFDSLEEGEQVAKDTSSGACRGYWLTRKQFLTDFYDRDYVIVPKFLWPVAHQRSVYELLEKSDVEAVLKASESRCTMLSDGERRVFVVSDQWLEMTS